MNKFLFTQFLAFIILSTFSFTIFSAQNINPEDACKYLTDERFRGNLTYHENKRSGNYSCASLRKPIDKGEPSTSDLRYSVKGNKSSAEQISLLMRMNSFKVSVPVLKEFSRVSGVIYSKAFGSALPEEVNKTILSAQPGKWTSDEYTIILDRKFDKTRTYELDFIIQMPN